MSRADPNLLRRLRGLSPSFRPVQPSPPGPLLVAALPRAPRTRARRNYLPLAVASVLLHGLVIAAFWLPKPEPTPELSSPPGVSMIFDQGATTPTEKPSPEPSPSAPMAAPAEPSPQPVDTPPPAPVEPPPPVTAEPTPPEQPVTPPAAEPTPTPPVPPTPPAKPEEQTDEAPAVRFQSPDSLRAFLVPVPIPQAQPLLIPPVPQPRPAPRTSQTPAQTHASSFPKPMFNSLGTSFSGVPEGQRDQPRAGGYSLQPFAQTSGTPLGAGWNELFRNWVESHKYYPRTAAELGQQGVVTVEITIQSDGHVSDLHLVEQSGSPWLDMALQSMFRDAHVPPFPPGTKDPSVTYRVQMTYRLR